METAAIVCTVFATILSISELPAFKGLRALESDRGKKIRVTLLVLFIVMGAWFQRQAQNESDEARSKAESSRDAMLAVLGTGVGALKVAEEGRAAAEAARVQAERERDEVRAAAARREARLHVSWTPLPGRSVDVARLKTPITITAEMLQDRREYLLAVTNPSGYRLSDASFDILFPYPVESSELARALGIAGLAFQPSGSRISGSSIGGGTVQIQPGGCTWSYALSIAELRPEGRVEILVRLYSGWRIPDALAGRIDGRYRYPLGGEAIPRPFYAPLEAQPDKSVLMGSPRTPPKTRTISFGFANCGPS